MTEREALLATWKAARKVAQDADAALSLILVESYGVKRAGDMRYRPAETNEIEQAMQAKVDADALAYRAGLAFAKSVL